MVRILAGMKLEEAPESVAWRAKRRFFFKNEHDVHLYYLVLESHEFDEVKDDLVLDWRGNIVMKGGWQGVADGMTAEFGVEFKAEQVQRRMKLLEDRGEVDGPFFAKLFDEAMDLRDRVESGRVRLLSLLQARILGHPEHKVPQADRLA